MANSPNTERWLQFHTAALAVMGTWLLGAGQQSTTLPGVLTVVAVTSLLPLSFVRWMRLNRLVANIAALSAVVWSLHDFFHRSSDGQLLAIADMLICLQMVLLLQEKSDRVHWQLMVLSVLQVVVAAALHLGPQFAILLAIYMAVAISTLLVLCMNRDWASKLGPSAPDAEPATAEGVGWQRLLARPTVNSQPNPAEYSTGLRYVLPWQASILSIATFAFTIVFFYCIPRLGDGAWQGSRSVLGAQTGFTGEMTLDELGSIRQSNELVMRVRFSRHVDRKLYSLIDEPYFHGNILLYYRPSPDGYRWVAPNSPSYKGRGPTKHVHQPSVAQALVRQDVVMENSSSPILFAVLPLQRLADTPDDVRYLPISQRIVRAGEEGAFRREYRYSLGTIAFRDGRQLHATPHINALRFSWDHDVLALEKQRLTEFDPDQFPTVARLADEIVREGNLESASPLAQILALERHFHEQGRYQYSLEMSDKRNLDLDPVEDFVANHRTGHCEYFASALAMMLRSRGIPSRIVTGYKGGEFNSLGNYYQVRQKHAHAWVEAYLPAKDVPIDEIAGTASRGGAWYRLDPTPSSRRLGAADARQTLASQVGDAFDYVDLLWRDYVLGLNSSRQRDSVFEPLASQVGTLPTWMDADRFQHWIQKPRDLDDGSPTKAKPPMIEWRLVVFTSLVLGFGLAVLRAGALLWTNLRWSTVFPWKRGRLGLQSATPRFYRRLETLLNRLGIRRQVGQTPREFAAVAAAELSRLIRADAAVASVPAGADDGIAALPARIVEAYYQTRFGGAQLDRLQLDEIDQALDRIIAATSKRK